MVINYPHRLEAVDRQIKLTEVNTFFFLPWSILLNKPQDKKNTNEFSKIGHGTIIDNDGRKYVVHPELHTGS